MVFDIIFEKKEKSISQVAASEKEKAQTMLRHGVEDHNKASKEHSRIVTGQLQPKRVKAP